MTDELEEFERLLKKSLPPEPDERAKNEALSKGMAAFDKKISESRQGIAPRVRLMDAVRAAHNLITGGDFMKKAYIAAGLCLLGVVFFETNYLSDLIGPEQEKIASKKVLSHKETLISNPNAAALGKDSAMASQAIGHRKESVAAESSQLKSELSISPGSLPAPPTTDRLAADAAPPPPPPPPAPMVMSAPIAGDANAIEQQPMRAGKAMGYAAPSEKKFITSNNMAAGALPMSPPPMESFRQVRPCCIAVMPVQREEERDKFDHFAPSPVKQVAQEPVSTFSADVDTSSYSFMRARLNGGTLPTPDAVRVEELVNYFPYEYATPESKEEPFKPTVSVFPTPWNANTKLLHIGIKGYQIAPKEKPHSNLVFLLDTSGSMDDPVRLPLVINAMKLLLGSLSPEDTVAIVTYAGNAGVALEPTPVSDKTRILVALDSLGASGSTAGSEGLQTAYALAEQHFNREGVNRVILSTDGDFNVGITDQEQLKQFIAKERDKGIFLSIMGVGMGNYNDALMQTLAQNGNGVAAYIDNLNEARKVLVEESGSTLFTIAKDVKFQVEFNPAQVAEYRLLGYESRALNREDFNNDKVDAGDVGSGHAVTAIYEITPVGSSAKRIDDLRYQQAPVQPAPERKDSGNGEYAFLKIRYKLPNSNTSKLISVPVDAGVESKELSQAPQEARFAASVAAFGELVKRDTGMGNFTYDDVEALARAAKGADNFGYRAEFIQLVDLAKHLAGEPEQRKPE